MSCRKSQNWFVGLARGLWWPLLSGAVAAALFQLASVRGSGFVPQPATAPANWLALLEIGLLGAGLGLAWGQARHVARQLQLLSRSELPDPPKGGQDASEAATLLAAIEQWPPAIRRGWLAERLARGLEHVHRQKSAETLERELSALAAEATDESRERLAGNRSLPWITAGLGALALIWGLTETLGHLQPKGPGAGSVATTKLATAQLAPSQLAPSQLTASQLAEALVQLRAPLEVVGLALASTLVLIVVQSVVSRSETRLWRRIDHEARRQLAGRFQVPGTARDPRLVLLDRLTERLEQTAEILVERQALVWRESFERASQQWLKAGDAIRRQLEAGLHTELERTLQEHMLRLGQLHDHAEQRVERWWQELQVALMRSGGLLERQQDELLRLGDIMSRALKATGEVAKLEHTLNRNLKALAGSKNFEDTVMALSAAIHLLNSRVGVQHRGPELQGPPSQGKAA